MISYFFIGAHKTHPLQQANHSFIVKILVKLDRPLGISHSQVVVTSRNCACLLQPKGHSHIGDLCLVWYRTSKLVEMGLSKLVIHRSGQGLTLLFVY